MNPLVPTISESMLSIAMAGAVLVALWAVVSVLRSRIATGWHRVLWLLVVLLVPVLGAGLWFYATRRTLFPLTDRR